MSGSVSNITASSIGALSSMGDQINIPELIMAIQIERGHVLDSQLQDQLGDMQKRNDWLKDANSALGALRNSRPDSGTGTVDSSTVTFTDHSGKTCPVADWAKANGIAVSFGATQDQQNTLADAKAATNALNAAVSDNSKWPTSRSQQTTVADPTFINSEGHQEGAVAFLASQPGYATQASSNVTSSGSNVTLTRDRMDGLSQSAQDVRDAAQQAVTTADTAKQSDIDSAIDNVKSTIDTVNSQSQMDQVRLQGLMDKRNQAFDMMTNTLEKTGKSIDNITGNMR